MLKLILKILMRACWAAKLCETAYCKVPYWLDQGRALAPLSIVFLASYKCNLKCRMCFYYNEAEKEHTHNLIKNRAEDELTLDQVYKLIDNAADMKVKVFTIHGGEPLLYRHVFQIAEYAQGMGMLVNFVTNGTLIDDQTADMIVKTKINRIVFSLDGPEDIHDQIRGKGAFNKLIAGIKKLKDLGKKGFNIPDLYVGTYISGMNQKSISELMDIIHNLGVNSWGVGLITYNTEKLVSQTCRILSANSEYAGVSQPGLHQGSLANLKDEVKGIDLEKLKKQRTLIKEKNKKYKLDIVFPSIKAIDNYYNSSFNEVDYCIIPWSRVVVSPYGEVFPCVNLSMVNCLLGNIKERSLKDIWNLKEYIEFRKKIKKHKLFPICSKCCHINNVKKLK